jgi:transposase
MRTSLLSTLLFTSLLLTACKQEQKLVQYSDIYQEKPSVIYVAPLNDLSRRLALRTTEDSAYNHSLNIASKQCFLTVSDPLVYNGYYVPGPLASAQIAATEGRTGRQLRNDDISDYHTQLGIDAVLFVTIHQWITSPGRWGVEVEYVLRSTVSGKELLHVMAKAEKILSADFKGNPVPLPEDREFAEKYGCDLATAQRCRLVETLNKYVLKDLPAGGRARQHRTERYIPSHPEYFNLRIHPDGSVEMVKTETAEF